MEFVPKSEKIESFTSLFCSVFPKTKVKGKLHQRFGKKSHIIGFNFS